MRASSERTARRPSRHQGRRRAPGRRGRPAPRRLRSRNVQRIGRPQDATRRCAIDTRRARLQVFDDELRQPGLSRSCGDRSVHGATRVTRAGRSPAVPGCPVGRRLQAVRRGPRWMPGRRAASRGCARAMPGHNVPGLGPMPGHMPWHRAEAEPWQDVPRSGPRRCRARWARPRRSAEERAPTRVARAARHRARQRPGPYAVVALIQETTSEPASARCAPGARRGADSDRWSPGSRAPADRGSRRVACPRQ